jgi:hypothetical protein
MMMMLLCALTAVTIILKGLINASGINKPI